MRMVKGVLWLLAGAGFTIGLGYYGVTDVTGLLADQALWQSGTPAVDVRLHGREKSNRVILKSYELEVEFLDAQHGVHSGKTEFTSLFSSVDQNKQPEVHYDAKDPHHFALSWAIDVAGGRWM